MPRPRPLPRAARRAALVLSAALTAAACFTAGVVAGAGSADDDPDGRAGVLDEAARQIETAALHPVQRSSLDAAAVRAMLREAGDPWGRWRTGVPDGAEAGVGLVLGGGPVPVVAQVLPGSAAAAAGVRPGDEVRAVAGLPAEGAAPAVVAEQLRGPAGSTVVVVVARAGALRTVALQRTSRRPARVAVRTLPSPAGPVAVLAVPVFDRGTGRQVREALAALVHRQPGVVLDLRGNGGGLLDEAVETASAFLAGGPVVRCTWRDGTVQSFDAVGAGDTTTPLAVLVDGGSASAAEVVAGALRDRGRAVLVGSRTFGKGTVQEPRTLSDGSTLQLTVASWRTPDGYDVEGAGLEPDLQVAPGRTDDAAVRRAAGVLSGLRADGATGRG